MFWSQFNHVITTWQFKLKEFAKVGTLIHKFIEFTAFVSGHECVNYLIFIAYMLEGQCFGNYHGNSKEKRNFLCSILFYHIRLCSYLTFFACETSNTNWVMRFNCWSKKSCEIKLDLGQLHQQKLLLLPEIYLNTPSLVNIRSCKQHFFPDNSWCESR